MKRKLGELLVEAGAVTAADVEAALSEQSAGEPSRLGDLLLSTGRCTPRQLAEALSAQHELPFADLSYVAPEASALIPLEFQRAHKLVPFRVEKDQGVTRIHVALSDPTLSDVVAELRSQLKREVVVHVAPIDDIENVHLALSGEGEAGLVMGTVVEEDDVDLDLTTEMPFPALQPTPSPVAEAPFPEFEPEPVADLTFPALEPTPAPADAPPASVTAEELFGSLDLEATPATAPLSTDLADEIGRADAAPPHMDFSGFSALAPPMDPVVDRFGAAPSAPPLKVAPERKLTAAPSAPEPAASAPPPEEPAMELLEPLIEPDLSTELLDPVVATAPEPVLELAAAAPAPIASPAPEVLGVTDHTQKFGGAVPLVEPQRIPSFAIPPEVPVEPRRSPVAPLRAKSASLGRIALKRVAVNRDGTPVASPAAEPVAFPEPAPTTPGPIMPVVSVDPPLAAVAPPVAAAPPVVAVEAPAPSVPEPDLALPDWMRASADPAPVIPVIPVGPAAVSAKLDGLLARVETGDLPSGPVLAALFRMLVERGILDEAAVAAALEKL